MQIKTSYESTSSISRQSIRDAYLKKSVLQKAIDIVLASSTAGIFQQYNTDLNQWYVFCESTSVNLFNSNQETLLKFSTKKLEESALSWVVK